jgi:hypothetical protein
MPDATISPAGLALARAAEAMLRALGGEPVGLLFPAILSAAGTANELGLGAVAAEEVALAPVIVRALAPDAGRVRRELLFPAAVIAAQVELRAAASAEALFQSALGIVHQGRLLHIESVTPELFGGSAYLYRVVAIE